MTILNDFPDISPLLCKKKKKKTSHQEINTFNRPEWESTWC